MTIVSKEFAFEKDLLALSRRGSGNNLVELVVSARAVRKKLEE